MKIYTSKKIKITLLLSLIFTLLYTLIFLDFTIGFLLSMFFTFLSLLLLLLVIWELKMRELIFFTLLSIGLSIVYIFLLTGFNYEHRQFVTGIVFNTIRFFILTGCLYFLVKDFYLRKINLLILLLFVIYCFNLIFNII